MLYWYTGYEEGNIEHRVVFSHTRGDSPHDIGYYVIIGPWLTEAGARESLLITG